MQKSFLLKRSFYEYEYLSILLKLHYYMHDIIGREKSYSLYGNGDNGSPAINIFMLLFCSATWYASLLGEPPALDSVQFGWEADPVNKCLIPQNMRKGTPYAPLHVLQLVRCGCESELSCRGGKCGCMGRQMPCTVFLCLLWFLLYLP